MIKHMEKNKEGVGYNSTQRIVLIVFIALAALGAVLVPIAINAITYGRASMNPQFYRVGQLAPRDIIAKKTLQYEDQIATDQARDLARQSVLPIFTRSLGSTLAASERVATFARIMNAPQAEQNVQTFFATHGLEDSQGIVERIGALGDADRQLMLTALQEGAAELLGQGFFNETDMQAIASRNLSQVTIGPPGGPWETHSVDSLITSRNISSVLTPFFSRYGTAVDKWLVLDSLSILVDANIQYDDVATIAAQNKAMDAVPSVIEQIRQGERIIGKNEVITPEILTRLEMIRGNTPRYSWLEMMGMLVVSVIVTLASLYFFDRGFAEFRRFQFLLILLVGLLLTQMATVAVVGLIHSIALPTYVPALPVFFLPLFISLITNDKNRGIIAAVLCSAYAVFIPEASPLTMVQVFVLASAYIYSIGFFSRRMDMLYQFFFAAIVGAFLILLFAFADGLNFQAVPTLIGAFIVNTVISYVLVMVFLPLVEKIFNIPTAFMLYELSYADSAMLQRLNQVAQGTYNHSRMVAELAYSASRAVGVNALMARAAALYHDIGKTDHPEYFIENQSGENKHDELKPNLSAAIIKSHVRLGVEKGREIGLPQEILQIISEHHGNDVIYYFYKEAQTAALQENRVVVEEDFCYSGNPPTTKESAIVMLSDCVEAATRSIKRPTTTKYEKMIHQIIMGKIERDQLNDSHLSMTDLDIIASSFLHTLVGRDHQRIEYPEENAGQQQLFASSAPASPAGDGPQSGKGTIK